MLIAQPLQPVLGDVEPGLAQQDVGEEPAAHPDLAMDAPDRELDPLGFQCLVPSENVLIDAVHQRAVEVEQEGCLWAVGHGGLRVGTVGRRSYHGFGTCKDRGATASAIRA